MLTSDSLVEVTSPLKAGQRVIKVYDKWVVVGVGGSRSSEAGDVDVPATLYVPLEKSTDTTITGQTLINRDGKATFTTVDGVACADMQSGGEFEVSPNTFLQQSGHSFAFSCFVRIDKTDYGNYPVFCAYDKDWSLGGIGLRIYIEGTQNIFIGGGSPDRDSLNSYDSRLTIFTFEYGKWTHLLFNFYSDHEEVYVDGQLIWYKKIQRVFTIRNDSTTVTLGATPNRTGFFDGYMSQVKYYPSALSSAQAMTESKRCLALVK